MFVLTVLYSRSKDETCSDEVLPWSSVEKLSTKNEQGVEPTTRLVDTFRDEVGRESILVAVDVFERIVVGRVWHTIGQL
jgi:hypothetical protein